MLQRSQHCLMIMPEQKKPLFLAIQLVNNENNKPILLLHMDLAYFVVIYNNLGH